MSIKSAPLWATLKQSFYFSFCPLSAIRPTTRPKNTSPDFTPVRPPTSDLGPILTNVPFTHFIMDDRN